ncbi:CD82 protein, partial [Sylvia borin]|nr:CD82 protein [Sylvia borin]
ALSFMLLTFGLWLLFGRNNFFSTNALWYSFFSRELASDMSFLYSTWHWICYYFYVSHRSLWSVVEIKCLLVTYVNFQILVFIMQMAILVLIIMKKEEVHNQWNNRIDDVISEYRNESPTEQNSVWSLLNAMQHNIEFCERYNATEWKVNKTKNNNTQFPCSCTKYNLKKWFCDVPRDSTYSVGSEVHLSTWFESNALTLIAIAITLLTTQVRLL